MFAKRKELSSTARAGEVAVALAKVGGGAARLRCQKRSILSSKSIPIFVGSRGRATPPPASEPACAVSPATSPAHAFPKGNGWVEELYLEAFF